MSPEPERPRRPVGFAALGGFALGAATVLLIVWFYGAGRRGAEIPSSPPGAVVAPPAAEPANPLPSPSPPVEPPSAAPSGNSAAVPAPGPDDFQNLTRRQLLIPVQGVRRQSLVDSYTDGRSGGRLHNAIDILAPRDTPILAVEDGSIAKLFTSVRGGLTIYQLDPSTDYIYYYAHLDHYAEGLKQGDRIRRGQLLGYVGTTGDAPPDTPHLHFEITRLTAEKQWWKGTPINPFPILRSSGEEATPAR